MRSFTRSPVVYASSFVELSALPLALLFESVFELLFVLFFVLLPAS